MLDLSKYFPDLSLYRRAGSQIIVVFAVLALMSITSLAEESVRGVRFAQDIRPILSDKCYACHGFDEESREADLRLDIAAMGTDAESSGAIIPGNANESELIARIESKDADLLMPPPSTGKSLSSHEIELLRKWIDSGAEYEQHWAFVPPLKEPPPVIVGVQHPIDSFVRHKLAEVKLECSPPASPHTLLRRLSLDLTGIPPSPDDVEQFLRDYQLDAKATMDRAITRLLESPHYGERWGRWWLDQARYADSNGYSIDAPREMWPYRDWVIKALNRDLPFDQFTIEQLAGDLLPNATQDQKVATGFHRNTQINEEGGIDVEQFRVDSVFDRVATTSTVWLGLTVNCAQCHDHKFDPIDQQDYYQLFAFFNDQDEPKLSVVPADMDAQALKNELQYLRQQLQEQWDARKAALAQWESGLTDEIKEKLPGEVKKILRSAPDKRRLTENVKLCLQIESTEGDTSDLSKALERFQSLEQQLSSLPTTLVLTERSQPRESHILIKGDFTRPADPVNPGTLKALHAFKCEAERPNRLDLANWLMARENPVTARVIVNRIWQQYFGRGLVETESDFGLQGSLPSHPDLLDWLAIEFREQGWSLKQLHRLIVSSETYQQSSQDRPDLSKQDPNNYLLARQNRLRLDGEIVRDVGLAASGLLSEKLGGPSVFPPIPDGVMGQGQVKRTWKVSEGEDRYRRALYTFVYRGTPPPALNVFDAPDGFSTCTRRIRSNTPLQSLTLLNDPAYFEFAQALEKIIRSDGLETAFVRCTSRPPTVDEIELLQPLDSLTQARILLNLDETVTRE
ncbi:MAG: PSD1 domain-containing protein [Planctomycetales bacterium]|nr:PSD1 domain-containing protein [Planctomycetales bacterium]